MPDLSPVFVVTPAGHRALMAERCKFDAGLCLFLKSRAGCVGCGECSLKGKTVSCCKRAICPRCRKKEGAWCPGVKCVQRSTLADYDISCRPEIRNLYLNCPVNYCPIICSYMAIDGHIRSHQSGVPRYLPLDNEDVDRQPEVQATAPVNAPFDAGENDIQSLMAYESLPPESDSDSWV